jgi:hypothetical protein
MLEVWLCKEEHMEEVGAVIKHYRLAFPRCSDQISTGLSDIEFSLFPSASPFKGHSHFLRNNYHIPMSLNAILETAQLNNLSTKMKPPTQWVSRILSLGIKRQGRELTTHLHLMPRSKNVWSYSSTLPIRLYGVVLSLKKHRDNFTFKNQN